MLDNIDPIIWGDSYWKMLHYITLAYPDVPAQEDKQNVINFFAALRPMLPCQKCRNNFESHLKKYPLNDYTLSSKINLVMWLINIHNEVNALTGKKVMTYDEVINQLGNKQSFYVNKQIITIILLVLLVIILIYIAKTKN